MKSKIKSKLNRCWHSLQSILIFLVVISIFSYIAIDFFIIKPDYINKIEHVKNEYKELNQYLEEKIPEIDNQLSIHKEQLRKQDEILKSLQNQIIKETNRLELYPN